MERDVAIIVLVFLLGTLVFVGLINNITKDPSLSPGDYNISYSPAITYPSCSNQSIASLWDNIFQESSSGISVYFKEPVNATMHVGCPYFIAYKNTSEDFYFITGNELWTTSNISSNGTNIVAFKAKVTPEYLTNINSEGISNYTKYSGFSTSTSLVYVSQLYLKNRSLLINESNQTFLSTFKFDEDVNWTEKYFSGYYYFNFNETLNLSSGDKFVSGLAFRDYAYDYFIYSDNDFTELSCISNYVPLETNNCPSSGEFSTYFYDTADCDLTNELNVSLKCNYINLTQVQNTTNSSNVTNVVKNVSQHISGNLTKFLANNTDILVFIDSAILNLSQQINDTKNIEFRKSSDLLFRFDYNFSSTSSINIDSVEIKKQNSSDGFGYLIVNGLAFNKTLYIDRIANADYICIRNSHTNNVGSFSANCTASSEILLLCPGSSNSIYCNILSNKFIVSGLTNSGVREFTGNNPSSSSSSSSSTGSSSLTNTAQPTACSPMWNCGEWTPTECERNKNQTRICMDSNNCNSPLGKPSEVQECEASSPLPIIIFYSTLTLIIASIIIIIVMFFLSRKKKERFGKERLI